MTASVIIARAVTDGMLLSCSVPEPDAGEVAWVSGTSYALAARVYRATTHRIYERAVAGSGTTPPEDDPVNWFEVGPTNRWAAFDQKIGTPTHSSTAPLTFSFAPGSIGGLGIFDIVGDQVTVQMLDRPGGVVVYSRIIALDDVFIGSFYDWFFEADATQTRFDAVLTDLPAHWPDCVLDVSIGGHSEVAAGAIVFGTVFEIGQTRFGASASIIDWSRKERDDYGKWTVVEGEYARRATLSVLVPSQRFDIVYRTLASLRARLAVWVATSSERYAPLTVLGFYKDFSVTADYVTQSLCALEIEGV